MAQISHALVLPDKDFERWLDTTRSYTQAFERVAVVRSPAGNDLNRFRNVTAVQTPQVWINDDAVGHIRRVYPLVVRVDVITASTPEQLTAVLQARVTARDRYGESQNNPPHIFDRFALDWPSDSRPARITRTFSTLMDRNPDTYEGIDITAAAGTVIHAAAAGTVTKIVTSSDSLNYGAYVQITTQIAGQTYITTYAGLRDIAVQNNQPIREGDAIAKSAGDTLKLVVQNPPGGTSGMKLPNVIDPTLLIYWQGMRLRPTASTLRIRALPNTDGEIVGTVSATDALETSEVHGRALAKVGVENQWIKINRPGVRDAYVAGWFVEAYSTDDPTEAIPGANIPGINLDLDHRLGAPENSRLGNLGWVRLLYNVSFNPNFPQGDSRRYGNTDINLTFNRYKPLLERYARGGRKVILVFTHQTFGEGQGYVWHQMNAGRWRDHANKFVDIVRRIAAQFANQDLVYAYQIWNEQDTAPENVRSAVPMPVAEYAYLLGETIKAIRAADSKVKILTGGHVSGPDLGSAYARSVLNAMPASVRPDGIAFHPYGNGPAGSPFTRFGTLDTIIRKFTPLLPDKPVWITEWGVLDRQGDDSITGQVAQYVTGFMNIIRQQFPGKVACAIWYAWADSMDNGYGLVKTNDQPRQTLIDTMLRN